MTDSYDDIINLPHHVSDRYPHMPMYDRAAKFAPFAELTGHEEAINETSRYTEERIELTEEQKEKFKELGVDIEKVAIYYKTTVDEITKSQAEDAIARKERKNNGN